MEFLWIPIIIILVIGGMLARIHIGKLVGKGFDKGVDKATGKDKKEGV